MSAYASGDALGTAITQRLRNTFGADQLTRRRDEVAYRRLVARLAVADPLTGIPEVDELPPGLRVLAWPQQIAEKVCGMLERRESGPSGRVRDLLDLAMIAQQVDDLDADELRAALTRELAARELVSDGLPPTAALSDDQRSAWRTATARSTRGAPITVDRAEAVVRGFLDPVLDGSALGGRWDVAAQAWRRPGATSAP